MEERARTWRALAAMVCAIVAVYLGTLDGAFIWDDHAYIVHNNRLLGLAGLRQIWLGFDQSDYWPLSYSVLWLLRRVAGLTPWPYHAAQVLLHALAACLAALSLRELRCRAPVLAALLWAVHPVQMQVVAWPFQIKTTLCACFFFLSIWSYARWLRRGGSAMYVLSLMACVAALLSKSQAVMLPVVLVGVWMWVCKEQGQVVAEHHPRRGWAFVAPHFVVALGAGLLTIVLQQRAATFDATLNMGIAGRIAAAGHALTFYLGTALWPMRLAAVYPRWNFQANLLVSYVPALVWMVVLGVVLGVVLVGVFVGVFIPRRSRGLMGVGAGLLFFAVNLTPVLGLVDFQYLTLAPVADHFQYIALLGVTAAAATLVCDLAQRLRLHAPTLLLSLVLASALLCWRRAPIYRHDEALWQHNIAMYPDVWVGHMNLGLLRARQQRDEEAAVWLSEAARLRPDRPDVRLTLGDLRMKQGLYGEALVEYEAALRRLADLPEIHLRIGEAKLALGDEAGAVRAYQQALRWRPGWPAAQQRLDTLLRP